MGTGYGLGHGLGIWAILWGNPITDLNILIDEVSWAQVESSLPAFCNQVHIQIGTLPEPVRSALKLNKTSRLSQCLSNRFFKMLIVSCSLHHIIR